MSNSILLKRAMKTLNLTGVSLAEKVTALREDDKRTAPETISRWLTGTNQPDPFLMGWIAEMVRTKLRSSNDLIVRFPRDKGLVIGVTNLKGGVGTTTLTMNLAAIAKRSLHAPTTVLFAEMGPKKQVRMSKHLSDLRIDCPGLNNREILDYQPNAGEVVLVDIGTDVVKDSIDWDSPGEQKKPRPEGFLSNFNPDIYLIPAEFDSLFDVNSTAVLLNSGGLQSPVQLLHRPRGMGLNFAETAMKGGLDVNSEVFCPFFIPQSISAEFHFPRGLFSGWQNEEQEHYHYQLFEHLLEYVGGAITSTADAIEKMSLAELLDLAESR